MKEKKVLKAKIGHYLGLSGLVLIICILILMMLLVMFDYEKKSLLSNKIELNNDLKASTSASAAYTSDKYNKSKIRIVFYNQRNNKIEIEGNSSENYIMLSSKEICKSIGVKNIYSKNKSLSKGKVSFEIDDIGIIIFECETTSKYETLVTGNTFEGKIQISFKDISTNNSLVSSGNIDLVIVE